MGLDPVEQRLVDHAQSPSCRRQTLPALDQPYGLLLEFERAARASSSSLPFSLLELDHPARDTFFGGKVTAANLQFTGTSIWPIYVFVTCNLATA